MSGLAPGSPTANEWLRYHVYLDFPERTIDDAEVQDCLNYIRTRLRALYTEDSQRLVKEWLRKQKSNQQMGYAMGSSTRKLKGAAGCKHNPLKS